MEDLNRNRIPHYAGILKPFVKAEGEPLDDDSYAAAKAKAVNHTHEMIEMVSSFSLNDHLNFGTMSYDEREALPANDSAGFYKVESLIGKGGSTLFEPGNMTDAQFELAYKEAQDKALNSYSEDIVSIPKLPIGEYRHYHDIYHENEGASPR